MDWSRIRHTIGMCLQQSGHKRAQYLKKHNILHHIGEHCMVMFRKVPLYSKLISMGDNVWIASGVSFITHDVIHCVLNNCGDEKTFRENIGCIDIKDNVFIGSNSTILPNVTIGPNTIVGAGSLVNKSLMRGVYAGVPAKFICSFEDIVEKRRCLPDVKIEKSRGNLTEATVEALWKIHTESEEKPHDEQKDVQSDI